MRFDYHTSVALSDIPLLEISSFRDEILRLTHSGWRILALFGLPEGNKTGLCSVLAHDGEKVLYALRTPALERYQSLTPECPQAHLFEREIYEAWHIEPEGHPWLKPVRFAPSMRGGSHPSVGNMPFYRVEGEQVHEVAVGPVHAGIIEPGHFRFQCYGERVMFLEISLGYQHRGIEKMLAGGPDKRTLHFMECAAGDSTVAHTTAYATALERLTGVHITPRAHKVRHLALELERLANHTGDLGAIAGDTGFLPTSAWNGRIRGDFLNLTALFCGNRFGRGFIVPGGVGVQCEAQRCKTALERFAPVYRDVRGSVDIMFDTASVLARMTHTGTIDRDTAKAIGLVGVPARACGLSIDARAQFPLSDSEYKPLIAHSGDVFGRAMVRNLELDSSAKIVKTCLESLQSDQETDIPQALPKLPSGRLVVAQVEGWRGEICHVAVTDDNGSFLTYKIFDPSFHNWQGLSMALRDQEISDFPLCNKSFNLSYCGHDL